MLNLIAQQTSQLEPLLRKSVPFAFFLIQMPRDLFKERILDPINPNPIPDP
jgi:hypothetical protein